MSRLHAISLGCAFAVVLGVACRREALPAIEPPTPTTDAARLCVGAGHACFVNGAGEVLCAGRNLDGQLGDGSLSDHARPVVAVGLRGVERLACGAAQTCAVVSGALHCWGRNDRGQLGVGDRTNHATPTRVAGLEGVVDVALAPEFGCALVRDGSVHCFGAHDDGRLGATLAEDALRPRRVAGVDHARSLAVGDAHVCVALEDGHASCWGRGDRGQLGDGTRSTRPAARPVLGVADARHVAAAGDATCVVLRERIVCFGANDDGVLGDGNAAPGIASARPVPVARLQRVASLALSPHHACARLEDGTIACWGDGRRGELGRGGNEPSPTPVHARNAEDAAAMAVGDGTTCLRRRNGAIACFGQNRFGAFGNGSTAPNAVAVDTVPDLERAIRDAAPPPLSAAASPSATAATLGMGDAHACLRGLDGRVRCVGLGGDGRLGHGSTATPAPGTTAEVASLRDAVSLASHGATTCARRETGELACWGRSEGTLGQPGVRSSSVPVPVRGIVGAQAVAVGRGFACAVVATGAVRCWGENGFGQLGTADRAPRDEPNEVGGITDATAIAAGRSFVCALRAGGAVACWGDGGRGQLGHGALEPSSIPVAVAGLRDAVRIAAHDDDACAVRRNGTVVCWGQTAAGAHPVERAGDPFAMRPMALPGVVDAIDVAVGAGFACVLGRGGDVHCLGRNVEGQAGASPRTTPLVGTATPILLANAEAPDASAGARSAVAIAAGQNAACALLRSGELACWGGGPILEGRRNETAESWRPATVIADVR